MMSNPSKLQHIPQAIAPFSTNPCTSFSCIPNNSPNTSPRMLPQRRRRHPHPDHPLLTILHRRTHQPHRPTTLMLNLRHHPPHLTMLQLQRTLHIINRSIRHPTPLQNIQPLLRRLLHSLRLDERFQFITMLNSYTVIDVFRISLPFWFV